MFEDVSNETQYIGIVNTFMGSLMVEVKQGIESWQTVFYVEGNQGDEWHQAFVDLAVSFDLAHYPIVQSKRPWVFGRFHFKRSGRLVSTYSCVQYCHCLFGAGILWWHSSQSDRNCWARVAI